MTWLDVNGVSINYRMEGNAGGPLVVLLHEIGGTLESFSAVVPSLSPGYSVLSFDQRGSGLSEKVRGQIGIDDLVDDLAELISTVAGAQNCNLVTVAAAGLQALRFYERYEDRVDSMTLCNPALGVDASRASALVERADFAEKNGIRAGLDATLEKSYQLELRDDEVFPAFRGRYLANDPYGFAEANRVLAMTDMRHVLPGLRRPVMVVAGRQDQVRPFEGSQEVAEKILGSRFELIDGGHFLPITSPRTLGILLIDFLGSVGRTGKS